MLAYTNSDCRVGVIIGTGSNTCYLQPSKDDKDKYMIINIECMVDSKLFKEEILVQNEVYHKCRQHYSQSIEYLHDLKTGVFLFSQNNFFSTDYFRSSAW